VSALFANSLNPVTDSVECRIVAIVKNTKTGLGA